MEIKARIETTNKAKGLYLTIEHKEKNRIVDKYTFAIENNEVQAIKDACDEYLKLNRII